MNNVVLIGRLTRDPELRYIPTGTPVSQFTIAVDRNLSKEKRQEAESRNQPTADFIRIVVWGRQAENCANYLAKGSQVGVQGRIQTSSYDDKNGNRVYTTDVVADRVEFLGGGGTGGNRAPQYNEPGMDFSDIEGFHPTDNNDDIPF